MSRARGGGAFRIKAIRKVVKKAQKNFFIIEKFFFAPVKRSKLRDNRLIAALLIKNIVKTEVQKRPLEVFAEKKAKKILKYILTSAIIKYIILKT